MERASSAREVVTAPLDLGNGVVILRGRIDAKLRLETEVEQQTQRVRDMMREHVGKTFEMEGQARTYFRPGEDFTGIPHHFEDWQERPVQVTTGFRPMTVLGVTEGVIVEIEGEDKYPVLEPYSLNFNQPHNSTA